MKKTETHPIIRIKGERRERLADEVVTEIPITIFVNDFELATILCTPEDLLDLTTGFLYSEMLIKKIDDIIFIENDEKKGVVSVSIKKKIDPLKNLTYKRLITSGCFNTRSLFSVSSTNTLKKIESSLKITGREIVQIIREMQQRSVLFRKTGGVHTSAICTRDKVLFFSEDIGRHNAMDKVIGHCLRKGVSTDDKVIITSGRVSSAVLLKIVRASIPVLISRTAPTSEAVKLAKVFGVTLICFARGSRFNIYSNARRIV